MTRVQMAFMAQNSMSKFIDTQGHPSYASIGQNTIHFTWTEIKGGKKDNL